ncbi:MAG TPA: preprotein translocase subunit SecA, partial [Candidatus Megaira endosymbiont of Hartmannula sinica]|nr:preprotein translocase subunit SecA [Candidatus Megaera endosymbiont of Hartmannula sinica]
FGSANSRIINKLQRDVDKINQLEKNIADLSDQDLKNITNYFKEILAGNNQELDSIIHEAFAVVREASKRVLNMRHYDVQLIGGIILHQGKISQMHTGEGKTLVATLPAYLNALRSPVHIVTVNDYLARRDANLMGQIFSFLGMKTSFITGDSTNEERINGYNSDILYITNNELGFDFLRDNMKFTLEDKVQKKLSYAIIDEVDSILIDEARTPLIISGPVNNNTDLYLVGNMVTTILDIDQDIEKDEKQKNITLTDTGVSKIEEILWKNKIIKEDSNLYDFDNLTLVHHINQSLKAHFIFNKDKDYIVKDNKIMLIDEFTGRIMDGRRYSDGLHQAIEAKEQVEIQNENQTLASITFQNYFRMYDKLSGMTGTAATEAEEFKNIYNLEVIVLPPNKKITRIDHDDELYGTKIEKYDAIVRSVISANKKGQPILIGTVSIEKSEEISLILQKNNIKHNVLNAKYHKREAEIISNAGKYGAVTIATNMAGRGTDIVLGGNIDREIETLQKELSSGEIDNNSYQINIENLKNNFKEKQQKVITAGGLFVIGTERHESRRIDNQLRGRSGRQGDIGETKFFLSLEDDLMRIFASDRISSILRNIGLKNGELIKHPIITRSLEKAQVKVEASNYEIRKNLLKFDDVMNKQRSIIYEQRADIIKSQDISKYTLRIIDEVVQNMVRSYIIAGSYKEEWNLDGLVKNIHTMLNLSDVTKDEILNINGAEEEVSLFIKDKVIAMYNGKKEKYDNEVLNKAQKYILLSVLDRAWKEHLHSLDHLRQGISLRAYGQKDPLNEYKKEAYSLFEDLLDKVHEIYITNICFLTLDGHDAKDVDLKNKQPQEMTQGRVDPAFEKYNQEGSQVTTKARPFKIYVDPNKRDKNDPASWGKLSRNESCPCGSGKKYKHCHGKLENITE